MGVNNPEERAISVNRKLAELLAAHGLYTTTEGEFIQTRLQDNIRLKGSATFHEINSGIHSQLNVTIQTDKDEHIVECFSDFGLSMEDALDNNLKNFSMSTLHPVLAAFEHPHFQAEAMVEEWTINGNTWKVYLGNLTPKIIGSYKPYGVPDDFFCLVEQRIHHSKLNNRLHWFRAYYAQFETTITTSEFLKDNDPIETEDFFKALPIVPHVTFFSCRFFLILKRINNNTSPI